MLNECLLVVFEIEVVLVKIAGFVVFERSHQAGLVVRLLVCAIASLLEGGIRNSAEIN
jgi:hypothetical protein